jgi:hypothetical protein
MKLRSKITALVTTVWALTSCTAPLVLAQPLPKSSIQIGVYYFPGWESNLPDAPFADPWSKITPYPDRMPLKGAYDDGDPAVMRKQLDEMNEGHISFVAFDSYSSSTGNHGVDRDPQATLAYMKVATDRDPKFTLLWANHDKLITSVQDWDNTITWWASHYMVDRRFLRVKGLPIVIVFGPEILESRAKTFGMTTSQLFSRAQDIAHHYGLPGISFVAGHGPQPALISGVAKAAGYVALTDYNLGTFGYTAIPGTGFSRRDKVYQQYWYVYKRDADLPAILPISVGWDHTPWGDSPEKPAEPTPDEFAKHLASAITILEAGTDPFSRMGVICCWNEYGEGSILEPTVKYHDAYLKVLGAQLSKAP